MKLSSSNFSSQRAVKRYGLALMLAAASPFALADADIGVQPVGTPAQATANVDLRVIVPQVLVFGVGALGDNIAQLQWSMGTIGDNQSYAGPALPAFGATAVPGTTNVVATVVSDGDAGALTASASGNAATLPVYMFSNSGSDVTITATASGGATGGGTPVELDPTTATGDTIPITDFTLTNAGTINHPMPTATGGTATVAATAGIVDTTDTWTYAFTPSGNYVAGTYEARITYVASTP